MVARVKEKPILFSAAMIRAILAGSKTMTRRVVKNPRVGSCWSIRPAPSPQFAGHTHDWWLPDATQPFQRIKCPYGQVGDRLWVRETCRAKELTDEQAEARAAMLGEEDACYGLDGVEYLADHHFRPIENTQQASGLWLALNSYQGKRGATVPPIHMPRWASRIDLEITGIRVERLQEISEAEAMDEGAGELLATHPYWEGDPNQYRKTFHALWDSINGTKSWFENPWVWVIEFKRVKP